MSEYTNGPWIWEEGTPEIRRQWNGKTWPVATVDNCRLGWHEDRNSASREAGANARLIAAAPDLLAACQRALEQTDPNARPSDYVLLRAAIAKATGEQP